MKTHFVIWDVLTQYVPRWCRVSVSNPYYNPAWRR